MTRKIKFRAWDIDSSTMNYMKNRNTDFCFEFNDSGEMELWCPYHSDDGNYDTEKRNAEIMQSTGLFDKNGSEVYEGDIVEEELGTRKHIWVIEYRGNCFCPCNKDNSLLLYRYEDLSVIGNVYEHPELLTK